MILILVFTVLFGWAGIAVAQEAPPPIDPIQKMELIQKQNEILRRQNALLQAQIQIKVQLEQQNEKLRTEAAAIEKLATDVDADVQKLLEGAEGWTLNSKLEWVQKKEPAKDGGG